MPLDRRDTLRLLGGTAAALALGGPQALAQTLPDLVLVQAGTISQRVRTAVDELGGIGRFVKRGDKVVIKPNIGFGNPPERASTTNPEVVRAMAELVLEAGAKQILVFDYPCHKPDIAFDVSGIPAALKGLDQVTCYNLKGKDLFTEVPIPAGVAISKQDVARDILEADSIINLPCAKSHGSARVSFGMKNWMGVVKERRWWHVGVDLHQAIADLSTIIRPKLVLVDATRALVTGGPSGPGEVRELHTVVAGADPVAVDTLALTLAPWEGKGYTPDQVKYIGMAVKAGVGRSDIENMAVRKLLL